MDKKIFAIGVLSITAMILLVGLVLTTTDRQPAVAGEISSYGGDFTLSVGRMVDDTELLYVIDNTTQRMITYGIQRKTGKIQIADTAQLAPQVMRGRQP